MFARLQLFQKISKHQALDAYPKAIKQINFAGILCGADHTFYTNEEAKETV